MFLTLDSKASRSFSCHLSVLHITMQLIRLRTITTVFLGLAIANGTRDPSNLHDPRSIEDALPGHEAAGALIPRSPMERPNMIEPNPYNLIYQYVGTPI